MPEEIIEMDEIRINNRYVHAYKADYPSKDDHLKDDSVPSYKRKNSMLTEDFIRKINQRNGVASPDILPPNCRYMEKTPKGTIVVIEEPPAFRTLSFYMDISHEYRKLKDEGLLEEYGFGDFTLKNKNTFTLALPYCIFILFISNENYLMSGQMYFRVSRMVGLADYLMKAPFPNISQNQYICFGEGLHEGRHSSLSGTIDKTITSFWSAEFNTDYTYNYNEYKNVPAVNSFMEWHALSQRDPMFVYNVEWIPTKDNISGLIKRLKDDNRIGSDHAPHFSSLYNILSQPLKSEKSAKASSRSRRAHTLYYDVASGIQVAPNYHVHVGDPFYIKKGKELCYINSFMGFNIDGSSDVRYVRVENATTGKLEIFKTTNKFKKYLYEQTKEIRYVEKGVLKNGVEVKEGDIIMLKRNGRTAYKKLAYIRKNQEGLHEAKIGTSFYILENTEADLFIAESPELSGIKLERKKEYFLKTTVRSMPLCAAQKVMYEGLDVDNHGGLILEFMPTDSNQTGHGNIRINLSNRYDSASIEHIDAYQPINEIVRIGRSLVISRTENEKNIDSLFIGDNGVFYDGFYGRPRKPSIDQIKKYIMKKDGIEIKGFDINIDFSIGDQVVVTDWENPANMLSIKTIQGFVFNEDNGDVSILTVDKHNKTTTVVYINGENGVVNIGKVRHVATEYEGVKAGTKIRAEEAGIPYFPKKDVNIIIAFVIDTAVAEPLVLCSNCCTLWFNDVKTKFKHTPYKSKRWASMTHASIDISKIKYQPGDVIQGNGEVHDPRGWIVVKYSNVKRSRIMPLEYMTRNFDSYTMDKYMEDNTSFDCIPNPRISLKDQDEGELINAWPNLHGSYTPNEQTPMQFLA